jgi:hypothetical protein
VIGVLALAFASCARIPAPEDANNAVHPPRQKKLYLHARRHLQLRPAVGRVGDPVDEFTLLVGLDNNYPGGNGRVPGTPDGTEIITLQSKVHCGRSACQPCRDASMGARNGLQKNQG